MLFFPFSSFSPSPNTFIVVPRQSPMFHCDYAPVLFMDQQSLIGDIYTRLVSKHFVVSAAVSGFGDYGWDGSLGGTVSGWPFPSVSAPHFIS